MQQCTHKHTSTSQHFDPTSRAATPLCWWCRPDQRAVACWGHPHPRRVDPLGPPQGVTSGPDWSGTWGDSAQETSAPINSSFQSETTGRHSSRLGYMSQGTWKTSCMYFFFWDVGSWWKIAYLRQIFIKPLSKMCTQQKAAYNQLKWFMQV